MRAISRVSPPEVNERPSAGRTLVVRWWFSLLITTRLGNAVAVNTWNTYTWKPASAEAGVIPPRAKGAKPWQWAAAPKDGFHVLRHTYASIMLEAGESVVTLARWLGHSSSAITLVTMLTSCRRPEARGALLSTDCSGSRENRMPVETPQILPRAGDLRVR
ncbi:hypothetical protein GCM10010383_71480 [Streptomyces lomondensis]|uniref:Tyr recombinase domain-containing protein n=1 Tax=Streptomyces lomondensis TaxID=68229 RepID=A0ABQ2XT69_9ACTN|nr:hypothetical protein GCM10010383_71480 [Streptomyces lomondensis]